MGRFQRRVSRALIAVLAIIIVLGGAFYFRNNSVAADKQKSAGSAKKPDAGADALLLASTSGRAQPALSSTPATQPSGARQPFTDTPSSAGPATAPSVANNPPSTNPSGNFATTAVDGHAAMTRGLAQKQADDLLSARHSLNDALFSGQLSDAEVKQCKAALSDISQVIVFSPKIFGDDELGGSYTVQPGELMKKIAERNSTTWEFLCRINNIPDPKRVRAAQTIKIVKGPFYAVVSKSAFTMDLYLGAPPTQKGSMFVMTYPVGLGRDDSTPTGVWLVEPHKKIKNPTYYSPRGEGVVDSDDPKNPLGERWIGLTGIDGHAVGKASYGVHGTIEPDSIGKMASMGCIRMHNEDVEKVFDMLVEGKSTVMVKQ